MKKILITLLALALAIGMIIPMAVPASAASGPPERISYSGNIVFSENFNLFTIGVIGEGSFNGQINRPNGKSTEDSWFEVTNFESTPPDSGLFFNGILIFSGSASDIKVSVHNGSQPNQPIFTLRSSAPIHILGIEIPSPSGPITILPEGDYSFLQFQGLKLITSH